MCLNLGLECAVTAILNFLGPPCRKYTALKKVNVKQSWVGLVCGMQPMPTTCPSLVAANGAGGGGLCGRSVGKWYTARFTYLPEIKYVCVVKSIAACLK